MHERNSFVTLTYKEAPDSLQYSDFQLFMRRLRKARGRCRFYCGGEYGAEGGRPHFHAVLFGVGWPDQVYLGKSPAGFRLFRSDQLSKLWSKGYASVGAVTFESAAYVARYVMKKVTGDGAAEHYGSKVPEFCRMSLKPGIGEPWLRKFGGSDVFPDGRVVLNGVQSFAPRYYMKKLQEQDPAAFEVLSQQRQEAVLKAFPETLPGRLEARRDVAKARVRNLKRKI